MNRSASLALFILSVMLLSLGLIFLCAAAQQPGRLLLAGALLLGGALLAAISGNTLRRLRALDPEHLSDRITGLARRAGKGEVTLSQIVAEFNVSDEAAQAALDLLASRSQARREARENLVVYVFPGLKLRRKIRRCSYCGSEYPVKDPIKVCPKCGGKVELREE